MHHSTLKADLLLLVTALIWGFAFVAQRLGMDYVGPFTFNGVRFALGSLSLVPFILFTRSRARSAPARPPSGEDWRTIRAGVWAGLVLFLGASFQQAGLVYTTAGKAGFITGLYVVLVPILGTRFGHTTSTATWVGAGLALAGLYLLSVTDAFTIAGGDLLVLTGAFFWAGHVLLIAWRSPGADALVLAATQFAVCAGLSLLTALAVETVVLANILDGILPILYGGLLSVGVAYTLQVVAQKTAPPSHAAIILTLEGAFAALGGWLLLGETLSLRALVGCGLMIVGMLISQLWRRPGRAAS